MLFHFLFIGKLIATSFSKLFCCLYIFSFSSSMSNFTFNIEYILKEKNMWYWYINWLLYSRFFAYIYFLEKKESEFCPKEMKCVTVKNIDSFFTCERSYSESQAEVHRVSFAVSSFFDSDCHSFLFFFYFHCYYI